MNRPNWRTALKLELEGIEIILSNEKICPGDVYLAERNQGPKILTCKENNNGIVFPVEMAYPYDESECRKIISFD